MTRHSGLCSPSAVIHRRGSLSVHCFVGSESQHCAPVLLVPSIINRAFIFDLSKTQSFAAALVKEGFSVYLVDWGEPRRLDAGLGLGDYSLRLMRSVIRVVLRHSGRPRLSLFGYCLGGLFALIAGARRLPGIAAICALTTPIDLAAPGPLGQLTEPRLLDIERLSAAFPIVPGALLWAAFQTLDPLGSLRKIEGLRARADDPDFVARFAAIERWLADPVSVTGRALREIVELLYRENRLARGTLEIDGGPVRLSEGRAPVLNLIAAADTTVPPSAARPLAELWGGAVDTLELPGGHLGITVGSRAPRNMWTQAADWLMERTALCHV